MKSDPAFTREFCKNLQEDGWKIVNLLAIRDHLVGVWKRGDQTIFVPVALDALDDDGYGDLGDLLP